ncbi:selenoprotein e [Tachysurus ichikawai]
MEQWALYHNLEYDSGEDKNPHLIFYNDKDEEVKIVPLKKMKADEICDLLDSLGFYKRSQKGEDVPEEFINFPLKAPRDEL